MADLNSQMDHQLQELRNNIASLRKQRELINLQAEYENEKRLLEESQRKLEAARGSQNSCCQDQAVHAPPAAVTQTPSKLSKNVNGVSGPMSPQMINGGFTIKGSAQTHAVDQFMSSLQDGMDQTEPQQAGAPTPATAPVTAPAPPDEGRPNSKSDPMPVDRPLRSPVQPPQSPHLRRASGQSVPAPRDFEERSLTVIHPSVQPWPATSDPIDGSTNMDKDSGSESSRNEDADSDEQMGKSSSSEVPPRTPTGPARLIKKDSPARPPPAGAPNPPLYQASNWFECMRLIAFLETTFARSNFKKEAPKVRFAESYLNANMLKDWEIRRQGLPRPSWTAFRLFLAEQLAYRESPSDARRRYENKIQQPGEEIMHYALSRETSAWHYGKYNKLRHLWERLEPEIKNKSGRNWTGFDHYHEYVDFLIGVEESIAARSRSRGLSSRVVNPRSNSRKRPRSDS